MQAMHRQIFAPVTRSYLGISIDEEGHDFFAGGVVASEFFEFAEFVGSADPFG